MLSNCLPGSSTGHCGSASDFPAGSSAGVLSVNNQAKQCALQTMLANQISLVDIATMTHAQSVHAYRRRRLCVMIEDEEGDSSEMIINII